MKKIISNILLTLTFAAFCLSASAQEPELSEWGKLQKAITDATSGVTVKASDYDEDGDGRIVAVTGTDEALLVVSGKTLTLDLDGITLDRGLSGKAAVTGGNVITIANGATLTVDDSSKSDRDVFGKGIITGGNNDGNGGGISNNGILTLKAGNITGNAAKGNGGGIYNTGTLTMDGGTVDGNNATVAGGGISNNGVSFVMTAGSVAMNTAASAGAIENSTASSNDVVFTISGGYIGRNKGTDGYAIVQNGTMNISGAPAIYADQLILLKAGHSLTKAGAIGTLVNPLPVKIADEAAGRSIMVSKAAGIVTDSDRAKLNISLASKTLMVVFNATGGASDPKQLIELAGIPSVTVRRAGLATVNENVMFDIYWKAAGADDNAYQLKYTISANLEKNKVTESEVDYAQRTIFPAEPGTYKVVERGWNWSYKKETGAVAPAGQKISTAKGEAVGTVDLNQSLVFTFTGAKNDGLRKHDESFAVNDFKHYTEIIIEVTVKNWKDGGTELIEY